MAKNIDVINSFVNGDSKPAKTTNLRVEGSKLFNYNTVIAERKESGFKVNVTKYSQSTTTIQNKLLYTLDSENEKYETYSDIQMGAQAI